MKLLYPLGFLLLLVACIDGKHALKSSARTSHFHKHLQERALNLGFCSLDCSQMGASGSNTIMNLADLGLSIVFLPAQAAFAIINFKTNIAVVLMNGFFGIFDIANGVGLLVNAATGIAKIVTGLVDLKMKFLGAGLDLIGGVISLAATIVQNKLNIVAGAIGLVFDIKALIMNNIALGLQAFLSVLAMKLDIAVYLLNNFISVITGLFNLFAQGALNLGLGVFNLVGAVLGFKYTVLSQGFIAIANLFISAEKMKWDIIFSIINNLLFFVDAIVAGQIGAIKLIDTTWQFFNNVGVQLFSITINGLVIVNGLIKGTLDNFANIVSGISFGGSVSIGGGTTVGGSSGGSTSVGGTSGGSTTVGGTGGGSISAGGTAGGSTSVGGTAGGSTSVGGTAGGSTSVGGTAGGSTSIGGTVGGSAGGSTSAGGTTGGSASGGASAGGSTSGGTGGGGGVSGGISAGISLPALGFAIG